MFSKTKLLLTLAVAFAALTAATGTATAASASVSPGGAITATSLGRLTFGTSSIRIIECDVQLQGSLVTAAEKVAGATMGSITAAPVTNCNLGITARALIGTPWTMRYVSIDGTLPNDVTGLRILLDTAAFELQNTPLGTCLYAGRPEATIQANSLGGGVYTAGLIVADPNITMSKVSGLFCPGTGSFDGQFSLSPSQTITRY